MVWHLSQSIKNQMSELSKKSLWNTIKFLLAIGLVIFVVKKTDFAQIALLSQRLSWTWLAFRTIFFVLLVLLKSFQYYSLIGGIRYKNVLNVVVWQNAISNFISNSAGIASYMTMLKAEQNVKLTRSGFTFIIVKFGDLLIIALYLIISAITVWEEIEPLHSLTILLVLGILSGLSIFLITILLRERFVNFIERVLIKLKLDRFSLIIKGVKLLQSLAQENQQVIFSLLKTAIWTSAIYMSATMAYAYTIVGMFNLPVSIWASIYITTLLQLISFVPIQVLGGLGVSDLTTVYLFGAFGINQAEMSAISLGIRALFYLMNAMILLYIPINALIQKKKRKDASNAG